ARYFPKHYGYASLWWEHLRKENPTQNSRETLLALKQLLRTPATEPPLKDWEEVVRNAAEKASFLDPAHRGQWFQLLAETCELQGNRDKALQYDKDATAELPVAGYTLARLLSEDNQHEAAAAAYLKVWEGDMSQTAALYLCGKSLIT